VGTLTVKLGDKELTKLPLVALEPVAQAGWFGRTWDALRLWIK
jgi:D-alanyl-D-alanine carboxypeptidase (penicillin-binding protein 5/6)